MMNGQILDKVNLILGGLLFFSLLLFPDLSIKPGLPTFQLIDFLMPLVIGALFIQRKLLRWELVYKLLLVFIAYIFFVIVYNGRYTVIRDYFELYKMGKFFGVILLFTLIDFPRFYNYWLKPTFIVVVIGNLLHYFNFFNINYLLEHHYAGGVHIRTFGLNSLGQPDLKRMVGFSGNPNINGLVFGFFTVVFFPKKGKPNLQFVWFFTAIFMFFLCQSRTNFIALTGVLTLMFFWNKGELKFNFSILGVVLLSFFLSFLVSTNSYINLLFERKIVRNSSLLGRFETWEYLWGMIKEKPLFGYGPFKEYFYERELYAENEYILQTWRYGFLGLIMFLGILLIPVYSAVKEKISHYSFELALFSVFILVNSLTNTPFSDPTTNILFAIVLGTFLNKNFSKES